MIEKIIALVAIILTAAPILGQNYYGEGYDDIVEHVNFLETHNPDLNIVVSKTASSIHVSVKGPDLEDITYIFTDSVCTRIAMKFSCEGCFNLQHKKEILRGKWKKDEAGNLHSIKQNSTLRISSIDDPDYCLTVEIGKLAITRQEYRKL